ncbi:hypothetical protein ONE63_008168 [Megalurothrips usitatus]|uniref:RNA-directed DNA polymerase n=1 Tax=Megalurothrips usitatus TaxID=439358 RepID=A0AAV7XS66_9NEOP|nr:hypothetical protein ONE63_008168 [Megalurothrips usitatus]
MLTTTEGVRACRTSCEVVPVNLPSGLVVCGSLLRDGDDDALLMRVRNVGATPRMLRRGTCVTRLQVSVLAGTSTAATDTTSASTTASRELPQPLQSLLDKCKDDLSLEQHKQVGALLIEFQDVFSLSGEIGHCTLVEHAIDTGITPPIKQAPRRLDFHKQQIADKCVIDMLDQQVIVPSVSPWASPVVLLTKKDGNPRFAIDYRRLNMATRKDAYPLPRIDETLDSLRGSSWFSSLDLRSGYWNIMVAPGDRQKTAFCLPGHGLYEFLRMPFGLCNAPATFQRLMDRLMPRHLSRVYLDDIIVPGATFETALANLREVLQLVREAKFLLHTLKCHLFGRKLEYLGHVVSGHGVATDPAKENKVKGWSTPKDKHAVQVFLGLAQYYGKYVRNFATISEPLYRLTRKSQPFEWTSAAETFNQLRQALTSPPVLAHPDPEGEPFILDCDASNFGIGAVLSQVQQGRERVISFYSRTLSRAERNYCVTRRELYAVVQAIRYFHHYLCGQNGDGTLGHADRRRSKRLRFTGPLGDAQPAMLFSCGDDSNVWRNHFAVTVVRFSCDMFPISSQETISNIMR